MATEEADDADGFEYYPQATAHAPCYIEGEITGTVLSINEDAENTEHNVGVIYENPTVTKGTAWEHRDRPDGFDSIGEYDDTLAMANADVESDDYIRGQEVTQEAIEEARSTLSEAGYGYEDSEQIGATDFKIADPDHSTNTVQEFDGQTIGIDVGGGTFDSEPVELDEEAIMVWYGGKFGQFLVRTLDFNGLSFARYTEDDYLVKGLLQTPLGWRADDTERYDVPTTDRSKLASPKNRGGLGRPPRIARPIILRDELDGARAEVRMEASNGGQNWFEGVHLVDGEELSLSNAYADDSGYDFPDAVIEDRLDVDDADTVYWMYHGEGWQDEPDGFGESADEDTSGGSFDMGDGASDDDDDGEVGLTDKEREFAGMVVEQLTGTPYHPDDQVFLDESADLEGLVEHNAENFDTTAPNVDAIRGYVIENVSHLEA